MKTIYAVLAVLFLMVPVRAQSVTLAIQTDPNPWDFDKPFKATVVIPADGGGFHYKLIGITAVLSSDCDHVSGVPPNQTHYFYEQFEDPFPKTLSVNGTSVQQTKEYTGVVRRNGFTPFHDGGNVTTDVTFVATFERTFNGGNMVYVTPQSGTGTTSLGPTQPGAAGHIDPSFVWN